MLSNRYAVIVLALCGTLLAGCHKDDMRAVNAIADANPMDVTVDGTSSTISSVAYGSYGTASGIKDDTYTVELSTGNDSVDVNIVVTPVTVAQKQLSTIYAIGRIADGSQAALVVQQADTDVADAQTLLQLVDAQTQLIGALDIYFTGLSDSLSGVAPLATLTYPATPAATTIRADSYRIRITPSGDQGTILFDSGASTGVSFASADSVQLALLDNTDTTIDSKLRLLLLTRGGSLTTVQHVSP
ncbi:MAG TPA: DUF4397 domain-containing protein [Nevskiaceae bacterium]|nr:DUF4397 domain-containing protein [Nevskiaceae bacterium]